MTPAFFSMAGTILSAEERALFRRVRPAGYILFNRNCRSREQVRALTAELRDLAGDERTPILIDHEGGRVQMLREPPAGLMDELAVLIGQNHNDEFEPVPSAGSFGAVFPEDPDAAVAAAAATARRVGTMLADVGISVNCAPVLDVRQEGAHDVIGDRSFGNDVAAVVALGRATLEGLRTTGVAGVIKHIPGHGRATADSHRELPFVDAPMADLEQLDFAPFRALACEAKMAMTAHIVYRTVDPDRPATQSPILIDRIVRDYCGFNGLLISDAIEMMALQGSPGDRARRSIDAGCDIVLCCGASLDAMAAVAEALPQIGDRSRERLECALVG